MPTKDYGLQYVDPQRIRIEEPLPENWETTKDGGGGTSRATIDSGVDNIDAVRARIDEGATSDDFARLRESDDPQDKAVGDSYGMFWGDDPVKVNRVGDDYVADGGRHRAAEAQARGTEQVPVHFYGPPDDPEFGERPQDAARLPHGGEPSQEDSQMNSERSGFNPEQYHNPIEEREISNNPDRTTQFDDPLKHQQQTDAAAQSDATAQTDAAAQTDARGAKDSMTGDDADTATAATKDEMDGSRASASEAMPDGAGQDSERSGDSMDGNEAAHDRTPEAATESPDFQQGIG